MTDEEKKLLIYLFVRFEHNFIQACEATRSEDYIWYGLTFNKAKQLIENIFDDFNKIVEKDV